MRFLYYLRLSSFVTMSFLLSMTEFTLPPPPPVTLFIPEFCCCKPGFVLSMYLSISVR